MTVAKQRSYKDLFMSAYPTSVVFSVWFSGRFMVISGSGNFSSHNRNVKFSNYEVIDQAGKKLRLLSHFSFLHAN